MKFQNFRIWRGRLPHWRADDVTYFVTFRHRRDLTSEERNLLFRALRQPDGRKWDLLILAVLPGHTELMFRVCGSGSLSKPVELSDIVEKAKRKSGAKIIKISGERFPPFYTESFDRIVRDEGELEQRWQEIFDMPVVEELVEDQELYDTLWVASSV